MLDDAALSAARDVGRFYGEPDSVTDAIVAAYLAASLDRVVEERDELREALIGVVTAAPDDRIATAGLWDAIAVASVSLTAVAVEDGGTKDEDPMDGFDPLGGPNPPLPGGTP